MRRARFIRILGAAAGSLAYGGVRAQGAAEVKFTTSYPVGTGPDAVTRVLAEKLQGILKQAVVIENKPGGAGIIAVEAAKRAPPTGSEFLIADFGSLSVNPSIYRRLPYDVERDFAPVSLLCKASFFITVSANGPYQSLKDLLDAAQKKELSYASNGVGGPLHLGGAEMAFATKRNMLHVAYRELNGMLAAVANGDVDFMFSTVGSVGPLLKAGKLRLLALADSRRLPSSPDVPTIAEAGGPKDVKVETWMALMAPAGTPEALIANMKRATSAALALPDVQQRLDILGFTPVGSTPEDLAAVIRNDRLKYAAVIKRLGAYVD